MISVSRNQPAAVAFHDNIGPWQKSIIQGNPTISRPIIKLSEDPTQANPRLSFPNCSTPQNDI